MDIRLTYVKAVIECRSFSAAAVKLHISQPALSTAIAKLERELKTTLIDRSGTTLKPTSAGLLAARTADQLQRQKDTFMADLQQLNNERPRLRLGMIDSVAAVYCRQSEVLKRASKQYQLHLDISDSRRLLQKLTAGELDMAAVVDTGTEPARGYQRLELGSEPMVLVGATGLDLLRSRRFISYPAESTTAQIVRPILKAWHIDDTPYTFSSSPEVMLHLVRQRLGMAVLPFDLVRDDLAQRRLTVWQPLVGTYPLIPRPICLHVSSYQPKAAENFAHHLRDLLATTRADAMKMV